MTKRVKLGLYILIDGNPVECDNVLMWARWFETAGNERQVAHDTVGKVEVSTIFLGVDYGIFRTGPPVLWETMVFGGRHDREGRRYTSIEQAKQGHAAMMALVQQAAKNS